MGGVLLCKFATVFRLLGPPMQREEHELCRQCSRCGIVFNMAAKKDSRLQRAGVSGYNKPKATPKHPTKSHVVVAKVGDQIKTIRFGQQGVKGSPEGSARNKSFKARHAANIAKGKLSAAYWADRVKW
jgi:hypothetical protein